MLSFQVYFEFNNLKDKDLSMCIMSLGQDISLVNLIDIILYDSIGILLQEIAFLCGFKDARCDPKLNWADW
jgi:hypothetical protein